MKTIHLRDENYNWKPFKYSEISELAEALKERKISIGDSASIGNDASIGNRASIGYEIKLLTGFYINGSRHPVTYVGEGKLSIGCHHFKISNWLKKYKEIGYSEEYSEEEMREYLGYIQLADQFYKNLTPEKVEV